MYTKEDIISKRICITGIPDRNRLELLQIHFFGRTIKETEPEAARKSISGAFYRFYQKDDEIGNIFGSMSKDYSSFSVSNQLRASKTIDYTEFSYESIKYTREDILSKKLYIWNIPDEKALYRLAIHMNPRLKIRGLVSKTSAYRFFDLDQDNPDVPIEIVNIEMDPDFFHSEALIDYSQFTYGKKYTREYVQENRVIIYDVPDRYQFERLFSHMFEKYGDNDRTNARLAVTFHKSYFYRFFKTGTSEKNICGAMPFLYSKHLVDAYNVSTYIPYSAFNYGEDSDSSEEILVEAKKEIPKLGKKWDVIFNDDYCIVNNVKWDDNFMKAMSDLLIRDMFEEMPEFEDNLVKVLEYYELYELKK